MKKSRYQVIEAIDLLTRTKSYKVYERPAGIGKTPIFVGLKTREEGEAKIRELEQHEAGAQS